MAIKEIKEQDIELIVNFQHSTEEVEPKIVFFGQERVDRAFDIAFKVDKEGYNIYVAGPEGIGKKTYVKEKLSEFVKRKNKPEDILYFHNFEEPSRPKCLIVKAGYGKILAQEIERAIELLKKEVYQVFESKEYEDEKINILRKIEEEKNKILEELRKEAENYHLSVMLTPAGIHLLPIINNKIIMDLSKLSQRELEEYDKNLTNFEDKFREFIRKLRELDHRLQDLLKDLKSKISKNLVDGIFFSIEERFKTEKEIIDYIKYLKENIIDNIELFIEWKLAEKDAFLQKSISNQIDIFKLNVLVDNSNTEGAPLIFEDNPTFKNLFGNITYKAEMGILYADHRSIIAGSLHKARGGYIVLRIYDLLKNFWLWEVLKKTILNKRIHISGDSFYEIFPIPHVGIDPEPVPLDVKVILLGDDFSYQILANYDLDFSRIFKIKAEFDPIVKIDENVKKEFPHLVRRLVELEKTKHLSKEAISELFKYAIILSGNRNKLNVIFSYITDVLREADSYATEKYIKAEDIKKAIKEKEFRLNLIEEKIRELIEEGKIIIDIEGKKIGQVNGLSVYELGDFSFGKPTRITATAYIGEKGIINIEREIELSGPIHSKGVLILSGYIGKKYGRDIPLALNCSITFEQSYSEVEGDSASAAELLAVLSAISEIKIRQDIAITGSIDQHGNIQPVGGIKEKIEGFFKICKIKGFTGKQGVVIPSRNLDNVLLEEEVLEEIKNGNFHIYTVDTIDDIIELMAEIDPLEFHKQVKINLEEFYKNAMKYTKGR